MVLSIRNNNPGNLRPPGAATGFESFATPEEGLEAMRRDLLIKISGNSKAMAGNYGQGYQPTLSNVINTWAPPSENDTNNYLNFIAEKAQLAPDTVLSEEHLDNILPAMVEMEGGREAVDYFFGGQGEDTIVDNLVDIELPDGTILEGVPADMSRADIIARLKANGIDTSFAENATVSKNEEEIVKEPKPRSEQNFGERMSRNMLERIKDAEETKAAYKSGEQGLPETALQAFFNTGVGSITDVIGEGMVSGARGLSAIIPDFIEERVKDAGASALKTVGKLPSFGGGTLGENIPGELQMISEKVDEFGEEHPRAMRNLRAVGNAAQVVPIAKGAALTDDVARAGYQVAKPIVKQAYQSVKPLIQQGITKADDIIRHLPRPTKVMSSEDIRKNAGLFYEAADEIGGQVEANDVAKLFDDINAAVLPKDKIDLDVAVGEPFYKELDQLNKAYNVGEPLSLTNLQNMDKKLTSSIERMAKDATRNDQRLLQEAQSRLRKLMDDQGGEGFKLYKEGRDRYARAKRVELIENAIRRSNTMQQPSSSLARKLNKLKDDIIEGKQRGFSDDELKMIEKAGKTGLVQGGLRAAGSRLTGGAALISGATAAPFTGGGSLAIGAGAMVGSNVARKSADALRRLGAKKVIKTIQPKTLNKPSGFLKQYNNLGDDLTQSPLKKKLLSSGATDKITDDIFAKAGVTDLANKVRHPTNGLSYKEVLDEVYKRPETVKTVNLKSPERAAMRSNIAKNILVDSAPEGGYQKGKTAEIILGAPGSGKSSVVASQLKKELGAIELDSDIIKEFIPEFDGGIGANAVHAESKQILDQIMSKATGKGYNIVHPIVGHDPSKATRIIDDLRKKGYAVNVRLVDIPAEESMKRVVERFGSTGRVIPPEYVAKISDKPLKTYQQLKQKGYGNVFTHFDNNVEFGASPIIKESTDPRFKP